MKELPQVGSIIGNSIVIRVTLGKADRRIQLSGFGSSPSEPSSAEAETERGVDHSMHRLTTVSARFRISLPSNHSGIPVLELGCTRLQRSKRNWLGLNVIADALVENRKAYETPLRVQNPTMMG
ncbi:hypothetical protein FRB93_001956 [Tulasnella sp. JGI-2019a]|nr:hypothetical protein FRB93_001956 [Tulasnella sp. JGI-2019a]